MSQQELELAAKAIETITPAVEEFAEATGVLEPIRQLTTWAAEIIYYRRAPYKAKLILRAAEKIRATGLPASAVSDRTLRAVLEDGALEDDPEMQDRWSNLLANEAIGDRTPPSYLEILSALEPVEAQVLDSLVTAEGRAKQGTISPEGLGLSPSQFDNLVRLGLIRFVPRMSASDLSMDFQQPVPTEMKVTSLPAKFVTACRDPVENGAD
jgi:hypothetical protein